MSNRKLAIIIAVTVPIMCMLFILFNAEGQNLTEINPSGGATTSALSDSLANYSTTLQILPLWSNPDTVNSGDDAITVKALSDSALSSGQNNYIFCYGDGDGTDDYAQFVQNIIFTMNTPDTLVFYVKFSESDSCGVDLMLRNRTASGTTVYADTTLQNPTGFTDDTWTRIAMVVESTIPRNTVLDLILKVQCETDETVSITNVLVK